MCGTVLQLYEGREPLVQMLALLGRAGMECLQEAICLEEEKIPTGNKLPFLMVFLESGLL